MDIEVRYDSLNLPIKHLYRVEKSKRAIAYLNGFIDSHRPRGYRLRAIPVHEKGLIEISSRRSLNVNMGVRALREGGFKPKRIPFRNHIQILKKMAGSVNLAS